MCFRMIIKQNIIFKIIVKQEKEGGYWAEVPALQGCFTQGETLKELKKNAKDAINEWFKIKRKDRF